MLGGVVLRGEDARGKAAISEGGVVKGAAGWGCGAGQMALLGALNPGPPSVGRNARQFW